MRRILDICKSAIFPVLCLLGVLYFGHFGLNGRYGRSALTSAEQELFVMQTRVAEAQRVRKTYERRVALLDSQSIDPDMLEERARAILGYAHDGAGIAH